MENGFHSILLFHKNIYLFIYDFQFCSQLLFCVFDSFLFVQNLAWINKTKSTLSKKIFFLEMIFSLIIIIIRVPLGDIVFRGK